MQISKIIINLNTSDLKDNKQEKIQLKIIKGNRKMRVSLRVKLIAYKIDWVDKGKRFPKKNPKRRVANNLNRILFSNFLIFFNIL